MTQHPQKKSLEGTYHRTTTKEWSNYDSVEGEMVSIYCTYVEAFQLNADGAAVGMLKIGVFRTDPRANGATKIDPDNPETFNFIGRWSRVDGALRVDLRPVSGKINLSAKWVGIFHLPGRMTLTDCRAEGDTLHANATYDRHPMLKDNTPGVATYQRLE